MGESIEVVATNSAAITPIPKLQLFLLCCVEMAEALNVQVLFPFLAFKIEDMGYTGEQLGYHAGVLAATFCGGQFLTSVAWGVISDRYGRKFAIVSGTLGAGLGMLIFGFSTTFPVAILGRFLGGLLCGNIGVVKSFLTEITDDTNRSASFYLYTLAWSIGSIAAPLLGGMLCKPAEKYPAVFSSDPSSIWVAYPYLLPCLITVGANVLVTLACSIFMVETVGVKKDNNTAVTTTESELHNDLSLEEGVQMSSLFTRKDQEGGSGDSSTRGRSSSIQGVDNSNMRARSSSTEKHSFMSIGSAGAEENKHESGATYSRLPPVSDAGEYSDSSDLKTRERASSDATQTTTSSTMDRSAEFSSDEVDLEAYSEDPDEICCPSLLEWISEHLSCSNKTRTEDTDVSMDSSSHELMQSDSNSFSTLRSSDGPVNGKLSTSTVLTQRAVILATGTYGMVCAASILIDETIPLFLKLDSQHGGFGFDSTQIGTLMSIGAAGMMALTIVCMPMTNGVSNKYLSKLSIVLSVPLCLAFPVIALLNNKWLDHMNSTAHLWLLWPLLIFVYSVKNLIQTFSFTAAIMMVNNSVTEDYLGAVNGLGQSLAALARCLGPAVGGLLWSVATKYNFLYLNFIAVTMMYGLNYYVSHLTPKSLDHRKQVRKR